MPLILCHHTLACSVHYAFLLCLNIATGVFVLLEQPHDAAPKMCMLHVHWLVLHWEKPRHEFGLNKTYQLCISKSIWMDSCRNSGWNWEGIRVYLKVFSRFCIIQQKIVYPSIHPFSTTYPVRGRWGSGAYLSIFGWRWGHPGHVASSSQGWHIETNNHPHSHQLPI